jgi:signal transduction histidine kinase
MKLLVKTSLYYLFFSIPILILSGFICYYIITIEVKDSNNELLTNRKDAIGKYLMENDTIALNLIVRSGGSKVDLSNKKNLEKGAKTIFTDTLILDKRENEMAPNRMITSLVNVRNKTYQIKVWTSTIEFDDLLEGIFYLLIFILFSLFLITLLVNFWIAKTLWKPFYSTVNSLKTFRASENKIAAFEKSSVIEFDALNQSLNAMMEKMMADYNNQKKFTENASHEIQTPLAVIKSKLDLLIQSPNLKENELNSITAIDDACSKLIRITKSLLLLTKIENRQYNTVETISFEKKIDNSLLLFQENIESKNLKVKIIKTEDFFFSMNPDLCLVLINNLIQNAVRYNAKNGTIEITIEKDKITLANSGHFEPIAAELFQRFQKNSTSDQSLGLGLSIIKEITEVSGLSLDYQYTMSKHSFVISVNQNTNQ